MVVGRRRCERALRPGAICRRLGADLDGLQQVPAKYRPSPEDFPRKDTTADRSQYARMHADAKRPLLKLSEEQIWVHVGEERCLLLGSFADTAY